MSLLTERILSSVDYPAVRQKRNRNLQIVRKRFDVANRFCLPPDVCDLYMFPLWNDSIGKTDLKARLIASKFYASTLWEQHLTDAYQNTVEQDLARNCLLIPIDQRYTEDDMDALCDLITQVGRDCFL